MVGLQSTYCSEFLSIQSLTSSDPNLFGPFGRIQQEPETVESTEVEETGAGGENGSQAEFNNQGQQRSNHHSHTHRYSESTGWHPIESHHHVHHHQHGQSQSQSQSRPLEPIQSASSNQIAYGAGRTSSQSEINHYNDQTTNSESHLMTGQGRRPSAPDSNATAHNRPDVHRSQTNLFDSVHGKKMKKDGISTKAHIVS